jgi:hypothetical protein
MATPRPLEREEYVEQAYFFRVLRERMGANIATQEILSGVHEEILSSTLLPYAIQFLAAELKHTGLLASGFSRLPHYFTPFQAYVISRAEADKLRFSTDTAFLILEREAQYRSAQPTPAGLFVYQFEALARNRLGYDRGLAAMAGDPFYDTDWRDFLDLVRYQAGTIDFADMVYLRSTWYVMEERRRNPGYEPPVPPLFGEKEGKIARASRGRDPLHLFAALQRQLGYPEVPRFRRPDDLSSQMDVLKLRLQQLTQRVMLLESEVKGQVDLTQFGRPDLLKGLPPAFPDDEPPAGRQADGR